MLSNYLKDTYKIIEHTRNTPFEMLEIRPRLKCKDGFEISIQASKNHYCQPRQNIDDGNYISVELGSPSIEDELITEYAECMDELTTGVYGYVPVSTVEKLIKKHDGILRNPRPTNQTGGIRCEYSIL